MAASDARARSLGFDTPSSTSFIRNGDNAISQNARAAVDLYDVTITTYDNLTATATSLPPDAAPTATVTGSLPNKVINIGVPQGPEGPQGIPGMGYEEGQQLLSQNAATLDAAQAAATDADTAATRAENAEAAALEIPDANTAAMIGNPSTSTAAALEARRAFTYATDHGAVGDGVTDDTAAIQAALDTGKNVILPAGTFIVSTLTLAIGGQKLAGWSRHATKLRTTTGDLLVTDPAGQVKSLEVMNLTLESGTGGGHLLNVAYGMNQSIFQWVDFLQRNPDKSAIFCDRGLATGGGLFDVKFTDFRVSMPTTSTVPGIHITGGSNPVSACLWHRGRIEGGGTYLVHLEGGRAASSSCYDNAFDSINFEFADHGAIRLVSCINTTITKTGFFDNGTIDTDLITVGRVGSAPVSRGVNINGLHRSGGTLTGGAVDVRLTQPHGGGNVISAVSAPQAAGMTLDVGNNDVFLSGIDTTVTVASTQPNSGVARVTLAGTSILSGASEPEGVAVAPTGSIYMRTAGAATGLLYYKGSNTGATGWLPVAAAVGQPGTNLGNASHSINTSSKTRGRTVFDNSTNRPVWATGSAASSPWVYADGSTAYTPI